MNLLSLGDLGSLLGGLGALLSGAAVLAAQVRRRTRARDGRRSQDTPGNDEQS